MSICGVFHVFCSPPCSSRSFDFAGGRRLCRLGGDRRAERTSAGDVRLSSPSPHSPALAPPPCGAGAESEVGFGLFAGSTVFTLASTVAALRGGSRPLPFRLTGFALTAFALTATDAFRLPRPSFRLPAQTRGPCRPLGLRGRRDLPAPACGLAGFGRRRRFCFLRGRRAGNSGRGDRLRLARFTGRLGLPGCGLGRFSRSLFTRRHGPVSPNARRFPSADRTNFAPIARGYKAGVARTRVRHSSTRRALARPNVNNSFITIFAPNQKAIADAPNPRLAVVNSRRQNGSESRSIALAGLWPRNSSSFPAFHRIPWRPPAARA